MNAFEQTEVSAFIICKDEAQMIGPCIESLDICQEIVIVDSGSTDGTLEIIENFRAKGYPVRLFERNWPGYAAQKQFALDQCNGRWCLNLDADERLDEALRRTMPELTAADCEVDAWKLRFRMHLFAYGYSPETVRYTDAVRLTRNGRAKFDLDQLVHEGVIVQGKIGRASSGHIMHARSLPLSEQIAKENHYSTLKARQKFRDGKRARWSKLILNPLAYFYRIYIWRRFFLCGWAGFIHAGTGAIYSFMTEAKLFQLQHAAKFKDPSAAD